MSAQRFPLTPCKDRSAALRGVDNVTALGCELSLRSTAPFLRGPLDNTVGLGATERGGQIRLRVAPDRRQGHITGFLNDVVADDAKAVSTNELGG
jgi:hypothetical protein